jgi:hypothetical protein
MRTHDLTLTWIGHVSIFRLWPNGLALASLDPGPGQSPHKASNMAQLGLALASSWPQAGPGKTLAFGHHWSSLKKLSQCLATLERLACHKSNQIDNTLKIIYIILHYLGFQISPISCDLDKN